MQIPKPICLVDWYAHVKVEIQGHHGMVVMRSHRLEIEACADMAPAVAG